MQFIIVVKQNVGTVVPNRQTAYLFTAQLKAQIASVNKMNDNGIRA